MLFQAKGGDATLLGPKEFFRLEQLQEEFNFCEDETIEENKRFKLIYLRDSEVTEFKNYKMVPLLDRDIPRDTFTVKICTFVLLSDNILLLLISSGNIKKTSFTVSKPALIITIFISS